MVKRQQKDRYMLMDVCKIGYNRGSGRGNLLTLNAIRDGNKRVEETEALRCAGGSQQNRLQSSGCRGNFLILKHKNTKKMVTDLVQMW